MIHKDQLKNKYVRYRDKDGKIRTERVIKIVGNYLTVRNCVGVKHRIYKNRIIAREYRKKGLEEIKWNE